ncbi:MAG: hypothetical protein ACI8XW_003562, partial [Gammaproteobacteria bacterium]
MASLLITMVSFFSRKNSTGFQRLFSGLLFSLALIVWSNQAWAACSPYLGLATLNELFKDRANQANDPDDFVELKLLDSSIPLAIYGQWSIRVCELNAPGNN